MDVTVSYQGWIFIKHSTAYGVSAVDSISRMARFYHLQDEECSTQILPHIVLVHDI